MQANINQQAFDRLLNKAKNQSYLLFDDIIDAIMDYDLPIECYDKFVEKLLKNNILVAEKEPITHQNDTVYQIKNGLMNAHGYIKKNSGQFVILAGSEIKDPPHPGLQENYKELRARLVKDGIIRGACFQVDYACSSASQAATLVLGRNANGKVEWITNDGVPLGMVQTENKSADEPIHSPMKRPINKKTENGMSQEKKKTSITKKIEETPSIKVPFTGIKMIPMSDIVVYKGSKPSEIKIKNLEAYYSRHNELDKPIVVSCEGTHYKLEDKYLRYYVAKKLQLQYIPAEMGTKESVKKRDELRKKGTLVWHTRNSVVGEVIESSLKIVTIKFDNGKTVRYDIHICLDTNTIKLL